MIESKQQKLNLFIYGSLGDPAIFKSVSGFGFTLTSAQVNEETLLACPAFLPGYRKVSPDNVYFYAVKNPSSRIEGYVIYGVPLSAVVEIDKYEGKRYQRGAVRVNTAKGQIEAQTYHSTAEMMKKHFGDRFHVNLIHELWLRKRIEEFIKKHTRPGEHTADAKLERRAERELLATTERDLLIAHHGADAFGDYYLEHELDRPRPSIKHLYNDPQARPFIKNYLALVVRQILLNQLDEKIQTRYRFEIEHMYTTDRYFKRSVSLLAALEIINTNRPAVDMIIKRCLETMPYEKYDLIDYVKYAVRAADSIFDQRVAHAYLQRIRSNFQTGIVPLGAELELSNLGHRAVGTDEESRKVLDPVYNGFHYFNDFRLDVLSCKLGGYIDDHSGDAYPGRRAGFFELAPGKLNVLGELSRPATADPWVLNRLIHEIVRFYDIHPHSLHLSFQLRKHQIDSQRVLPLGFVKCLLVLGGGLEQTSTGTLWVSRMGYDEIKLNGHREELEFARTSKRGWYLGRGEIADKHPVRSAAYVQQYKFIRLDRRANYEPLIMCLKGLQIAYNPGDYLNAEQLKFSVRLRQQYGRLKGWAAEPTRISRKTISRFLKIVQSGLMNEMHHRPAHKLHYIDWALSAIDVQLRMFNQKAKKSLQAS